MNEVNNTLYIPLYGKMLVSQKGIILKDEKAEEIWRSVHDITLRRKSRSKWLAYLMAMRARVFDDFVRMQLSGDKDAIVIHIGCGLDSRVLRVGKATLWIDIDFPDVIAKRKEYYEETDSYQMIGCDIRNCEWLDAIPKDKKAIIIMEGVSMYIDNSSLSNLFTTLEKNFANMSILMDIYTPFGAKMSKIKNPVKDVGVTQVYGIEGPIIPINNTGITYLAEHSMTPQYLIDELKGFDKFYFSMMYAGKMTHKLYRIYEYRYDRDKVKKHDPNIIKEIRRLDRESKKKSKK